MGRRARGPDGRFRLERGPVAAGLACPGRGARPACPPARAVRPVLRALSTRRQPDGTGAGFSPSARPAGGRRKPRTTVMRTQQNLVTGIAAAALVLVLASGAALTASAGDQPAGGSAWPVPARPGGTPGLPTTTARCCLPHSST